MKKTVKERNKIQQHVWQRNGDGAHKSDKDYTRKKKHRNREYD